MESDDHPITFDLNIPEQGISKRSLVKSEIREWIVSEITLWEKLSIQDQIQIANVRYQIGNLKDQYVRNLNSLLNSVGSDSGLLYWNEFISKARDGKILILQGRVGSKIFSLSTSQLGARATILAIAFSEEYGRTDQGITELIRAAVVDNPWATPERDILTAQRALDVAEATAARMEEELIEARSNIEKTETRLASLESLYHEKLLMEGPSRHWKAVAEAAAKAKGRAFGTFCVLLALPALVVWYNWEGVRSYIDHLVSLAGSGISLAGLAVITVPVVAYGWLLKHVSRSYVQNLAIETDARHRRVMTTTFLGLAKRKTVDLQEADRALILNALFRPTPPNSSDDGPPMGIADLLKARP